MENFKAKYVNPLSDWGFKRLFGTEMNKDLLLEFLRGLFPERDIRDITYLKSERQNLTERERDSVFDVMCVSADGTQFVVEMQKRSQRYFRDRALYYAAHPIIGQGRRSCGRGCSNGCSRRRGLRRTRVRRGTSTKAI